MHDVEVNLGTLSALHRMGVELARTTSGTGYSSLAYLKRFREQAEDRSTFCPPCGRGDTDDCYCIDHRQHRQEFAAYRAGRGVETKAQLAWLCAQRRDFAQGIILSSPRRLADMAAMLRRQTALTGVQVNEVTHPAGGMRLPTACAT